MSGLVAFATLSVALVSSCSDEPDSGAGTATTTIESTLPDADPTTTASSAATDPVACDAELPPELGAGIDVSAAARLGTALQESACQWSVAPVGGGEPAKLTLMTARNATSATFEEVLADPSADDPGEIPGLGEVAAYGTTENAAGPGGYVAVLERGLLIKLETTDSATFPEAELIALARAAVTSLAP